VLPQVVVVSPHLDDAVFSLGAWIARMAREGTRVTALTVFANDPDSDRPPSPWDAACGYRSEGALACELVGAEPLWLPLPDEEYDNDRSEAEIWTALQGSLEAATLIVCPGFPLVHRDHALLTRLIAPRIDRGRLAFYVEQPYASWRLIGRGRRSWAAPGLTLRGGVINLARILARTREGRRLQRPALPGDLAAALDGEPRWKAAVASPHDRWAKHRAVRAYASQLRTFGPLAWTQIALYELGWGGEGLGWLSDAEADAD
jgi:LmbE family N-acetylglucosaminyl deacetylase